MECCKPTETPCLLAPTGQIGSLQATQMSQEATMRDLESEQSRLRERIVELEQEREQLQAHSKSLDEQQRQQIQALEKVGHGRPRLLHHTRTHTRTHAVPHHTTALHPLHPPALRPRLSSRVELIQPVTPPSPVLAALNPTWLSLITNQHPNPAQSPI